MRSATVDQRLRDRAVAELELRRRRRARIRDNLHDPVLFAEHALGVTMWPRLAEMLTAVAEHDRVAVKAGRKVSKTTAAAILAIWWAMRGGKVLATSASYATLIDPFWLELGNLIHGMNVGIHVPLDPGTPVRTEAGGRIVGRQAQKRENLQGPSGAQSLYLIDEASGVRRDIVEAIEGNVAGGGKVAMFGNPTMLSGPFYDAFQGRGPYKALTVSSRESPNVTGLGAPIVGLAVPEWIAEQEARHGPDSPFVQIHVDGTFPTSGATSVVPLALIEAGEARWSSTIGDGPLTLGVDVARSGDDESVIMPRRGRRAEQPRAYRNQTGITLAAHVVATAAELRVGPERVTACVDVIGVGASVYDQLTATAPDWLRVIAVNVAEVATAPGYRRLRDQLAFAVADWLRDGGAIPPHDQLRTDLVATRYTFDSQGRYVVSGKDELRETLARSPDHGDALGLSLYAAPEPPAPRVRSLT